MTARVTMRDVARALDVSPMTVSRALRDDDTVSAETRAKVRRVADELGYVYDTTAQAFRTQKSGFVAVTLPSINNANFADTYRALTNALAETGMQLLLGSTNYKIEREEVLVRQLLTRNPEALVLTGGYHTEATRDLIKARGLPVIEIWDLPSDPLGHVVGFSNAKAMDVIVEHLAARGRKKLAFAGATAGSDLRCADRRAGTIEAAKRLGLPAVTQLDAGEAPVSMRQGAALVARLGKRILDYDAIVCVSDPVAFGVLNECRRLGIDVPGQLAITGFGHFDVGAISEPRITTVDVDARRIGALTAEMLAEIFDGNDQPGREEVRVKLVPGGTS